MFLYEEKRKVKHTRKSKSGTIHEYRRNQTWCIFRCDCCGEIFQRPRSKMDPKRLNNNVFHVCENCDHKKFAQKKGVEKRQIWDMYASSNLPIGRL